MSILSLNNQPPPQSKRHAFAPLPFRNGYCPGFLKNIKIGGGGVGKMRAGGGGGENGRGKKER